MAATHDSRQQGHGRSRRRLIGLMSLALLLSACETPNPRQQNLPPSETDLVLLKPGTLCQSKTDFLQQHPQSTGFFEKAKKFWGDITRT